MTRNLKGMLLGTLVVVLALRLTFADSGAPELVLRNRFIVGLLLLLPGALCVVRQQASLRFVLFIGELARLSDEAYQRQALRRIAGFGRWGVVTGFMLMLVSLASFAARRLRL